MTIGRVQRSNERYSATNSIEVYEDGRRIATGRLSNISAGGANIQSYAPVPVGSHITLVISDFGRYPCKVMRRDGATNYGVQFNVEYFAAKSLAKRVRETFGSDIDIAV